jgi:POT family proton-dependent oligopeptide transporter
MLVGGVLITLGHVLLGISGLGTMGTSDVGMSVFVTGLALIVIGTGHFKPSVSVMVNQLYPAGDKRREGAFGIFYMGINLGALLGTVGVAWAGERLGWHWGFSLAAVGMFAGLVQYMYFRRKYLDGIGLAPDAGAGPSWRSKASPMFLVAGVIAAAAVGVAYHHGLLGRVDGFLSEKWVFWTLIGAGVAWAVAFTASQKLMDRGPVASIFIFMFFNFLFWLAFEQAATSVSFFTDERMNREISGFLVPTGWFQNINPLVIIILSPIFGAMWVALAQRKIAVPQPVKIGLGLIWLGLGYVFMVFAGLAVKEPGALASMWLLVATYVLHTIGELFLSPTGLAYVTRAAPKSSTSLLMGVWFLSSFLAYTVGGKIAGEADAATIASARFFVQDIGLDMGAPFANFFLQFVVLTVGGGIVIIALTPLLRKLMRDPND